MVEKNKKFLERGGEEGRKPFFKKVSSPFAAFKEEGLLVGVSLAGNFFNLLYHIFMSRNLGAEGYGALNSLLSIFFVLSLPVLTIQTVIARFVASYNATREKERMETLVRRSFKAVMGIGLIIFLLTTLFSPWLSSFLRMNDPLAIGLLGLSLAISFAMPVLWGTLQGLERFPALAASLSLNIAFKCFLGVLLVILGLGVSGALGALAFGGLAASLWALSCLKGLHPLHRSKQGLGELKEPFLSSLPMLSAFALLSLFLNLDMVMVKHFFSPEKAGYYSTALIVGKVFLFLPGGIITVMFPRVSRKTALKQNPIADLLKALFLTLFLDLLAMAFCFALARHISLFLFPQEVKEIVSLIRVMGLAVAPVSLTYILTHYNLAQGRYQFLYPLSVSALLFTLLLLIFHNSLHQVLFCLGLSGWGMFLACLAMVVWRKQ